MASFVSNISKKLLPNVAIFSHSDCIEHLIPNHIERPQRVTSILKYLHDNWHSSIFHDSTSITDDQILLFHRLEHLNELKEYFDEAEKKKKIVRYDGDTQVCPRTRSAVLHSGGAIINAIDRMYLPTDDSQWLRTAYCCVRPPGHHATPSRSMGFCFINNAGIGARYAQEKYGVDKVAVLDFDVHHGNGTEDGFLDYTSLFYGSTHELGNYPGTGRQPSLQNIDPVEMSALRQLVNNDAIFDQLFDLSKDDLWSSVEHKPSYQVSRDHPIGLTQRIVNRQIPSGRRSRYDFRIKWREVLYEMIWFGPSLVIISAGFDAHDDDPLADLQLTEEDYYWATEATLLACRCCSLMKLNAVSQSQDCDNKSTSIGEVKCLSILEGGYHLEAISKSSIAHVNALFTSPYSYLDSHSVSDLKVHENITEEVPVNGEPSFVEDEVVVEEGGEDVAKVPIEEILKGLDQSISSLLMEALMSLPDPHRDTDSDPYEAIAEKYYGDDEDGEQDEELQEEAADMQGEDVEKEKEIAETT